MSKGNLVRAEDRFVALPATDKESGSEFGFFDQLLFGSRDGKVFDYSDWEARDIAEMMRKDYRARQLENVLTLPILAAERSIEAAKGDTGEAEWLQSFWDTDGLSGGCEQTLDDIIALATSAITYKKAFFEKVWTHGTGDFEGQIVYDKVAWRPQTTCRLLRDPKNGAMTGFEQEAFYTGLSSTATGIKPIEIPMDRAYVFVHGKRRDPLHGSSDMEIPYWCYKTKQKILFLWFQFLENVSLPRTIVTGPDQATANQMAAQIAKLKGSGVLPLVSSAPSGSQASTVSTLDVSGKGAEQFQQALQWLDNAAVEHALAGFLNLTGGVGNAGHAGGSLALSKDASDFFLQQEEAKTRELAASVRKDLFAPFVRYNKGPKAIVPFLKFEPLNDEDKSTSVDLLQTPIGLPAQQGQPSPVPAEFVRELAAQVADYIGLDGKKIAKAFEAAAKKAQDQATQSPLGATPGLQGLAAIHGATSAATAAVQQAQAPTTGKQPELPPAR